MKLLELLDTMEDSTRVRRKDWRDGSFLIKSLIPKTPLVKLDMYSLYMGNYMFSYEDLVADDWETLK